MNTDDNLDAVLAELHAAGARVELNDEGELEVHLSGVIPPLGAVNWLFDHADAVRARLSKPCPDCDGRGWLAMPDKRGKPEQVPCPTCEGRGTIHTNTQEGQHGKPK